MFHYLYCIKNIVDGKVYVGKHSTENLDDGYMGSGVAINEAIKNEGLENFRRHILKFFETSQDAFAFEQMLVDVEFINDESTYNIALGGGNGWDTINIDEEFRKEKNHRAAIAMNKVNWANEEFRKRQSSRASNLLKRLFLEGKVKRCDWTGRRHREETKRAIGVANSISQKGEKNSQFGTVWLHHLGQKVSKRVPREELESWINAGWICGRKMKFA